MTPGTRLCAFRRVFREGRRDPLPALVQLDLLGPQSHPDGGLVGAGDAMVEEHAGGQLRGRHHGVARLVHRQLALEHVHLADEVGHEPRVGIFIEVAGRGDLLQQAPVHHRAAAGHGQGLVLVVGDDQEGDADLLLKLGQLRAHGFAQLGVQGRQGLVQQQHARPLDQGAGERDALALAAGQLIGLARADSLPA